MTPAAYKKPQILCDPTLHQGHVLIEASAGTGKTYTIEHLVLDLVISGRALIEQILVVTFTDAATRELRERIRSLIQAVCDCEETLPAEADIRDYWLVDDESRPRLREALFRFDGASISTIHGFCHGVLTEQAFLGGRLFEQVHADGREIFGQAFREELRVALAETGPVGEGLRSWIGDEKKIADLEAFLFSCYREGSPDRCPVTPRWEPEELLVAFTDLPEPEELKTAGRSIYDHKQALKSFDAMIDTLFALAVPAVREGDFLAAATEFLKWADKERTLEKYKACVIKHFYRAGSAAQAPAVLKDLAAVLHRIEERCLNAESFMVYCLLPRVRKRLQLRKKALGLLDYDDMLLGVLEALQGKDAAVLKAALRRRWTHALVDEFQDTDPVQWEIFRRTFVDDAENHRLFLIGDPKQAIYGFRGADLHTYDLARRYLQKTGQAALLPLAENYRSTELLIEALNRLFLVADHTGANFFTGLNRYDNPVKYGDQTRCAYEEGGKAVPVHLLPLYTTGDRLNAAAVREVLTRFIAEEIWKLTDEKGGLKTEAGGKEPRPIRPSDIFILTRTAHEGLAIGRALRNYGIPHAFYKQDGLFQTDEALDLYCLLMAIDRPGEPAIRMAAWLTPFFGVPLAELPAWQQAGINHPLHIQLLRWKHLAGNQQWSRFFDLILTESGLARRLIFWGGERSLTNYLHLFELLQVEVHKKPVTLRELARGLKAKIDGHSLAEGREGNIQRLESDKEAVQILTMHKAKGLEAEVIFIGGGFTDNNSRGIDTAIYHVGDERRLHIGKAIGDIAGYIKDETQQENERLLYVALTRARSRLYLPFFGAPSDQEKGAKQLNYKFARLGKMYAKLQRQLTLLADQGQLENNRNLFRVRPLCCNRDYQQQVWDDTTLPIWQPKELLELPLSRAEEAKKLAVGHRGVLLTSFTRIKSAAEALPPAEGEEDYSLLFSETIEAVAELPLKQPDEQELPGGRKTGIFLHALIENIPEAELLGITLKDWMIQEAVTKRSEKLAAKYGFSFKHLPAALKLVYGALTLPIDIISTEKTTSLKIPAGLASTDKIRKEMAFAYPIPEANHPLLGNPGTEVDSDQSLPFEVGRGYLQGLIDYTFEHEGRVYLLDWKSDRLTDFGPKNIDLHVQENYSLQAGIYSLAVVRLLGIGCEADYAARFGGILYIFLRGLNVKEGIWFSRPCWPNLLKLEKELLQRTQWGGAVIGQSPEDQVECTKEVSAGEG
jgi:exodeoxyribonuclease V beta subunit